MTVASLTHVINQLLPEPHAGLMAGLLFGTKTALSPDLYEALIKSGTIHIVALSGMNITILANLVATLFHRLFSKRISGLLTILLILWFVWFVGPKPPIVRAAIMGSITLLASLFGKQYWALYAWAIALGGMLVVKWSWLYEPSFQLSAAATLGIILFNKKEPNPLKENLRLTLSAQLCTIPLILWYFHRISLVAPLANVLIGFLITPLTVLGWVTVGIGSLWLPLAYPFAWASWGMLEYLVLIVYMTSRMPFASISL